MTSTSEEIDDTYYLSVQESLRLVHFRDLQINGVLGQELSSSSPFKITSSKDYPLLVDSKQSCTAVPKCTWSKCLSIRELKPFDVNNLKPIISMRFVVKVEPKSSLYGNGPYKCTELVVTSSPIAIELVPDFKIHTLEDWVSILKSDINAILTLYELAFHKNHSKTDFHEIITNDQIISLLAKKPCLLHRMPELTQYSDILNLLIPLVIKEDKMHEVPGHCVWSETRQLDFYIDQFVKKPYMLPWGTFHYTMLHRGMYGVYGISTFEAAKDYLVYVAMLLVSRASFNAMKWIPPCCHTKQIVDHFCNALDFGGELASHKRQWSINEKKTRVFPHPPDVFHCGVGMTYEQFEKLQAQPLLFGIPFKCIPKDWYDVEFIYEYEKLLEWSEIPEEFKDLKTTIRFITHNGVSYDDGMKDCWETYNADVEVQMIETISATSDVIENMAMSLKFVHNARVRETWLKKHGINCFHILNIWKSDIINDESLAKKVNWMKTFDLEPGMMHCFDPIVKKYKDNEIILNALKLRAKHQIKCSKLWNVLSYLELLEPQFYYDAVMQSKIRIHEVPDAIMLKLESEKVQKMKAHKYEDCMDDREYATDEECYSDDSF